MARIRSIKPEFFTSEQVADCSTTARLLFVGLWCFADDGGVHLDSVKRIKMEVFPGDTFTEAEVQAWIDELVAAGLLERYVVDGKGYLAVTGWHHQRIEKPNFRYPSPPGRQPLTGQSPNGRGTVDDSSPPEGKGRERKGKEVPTTSDASASPPPDDVIWQQGLKLLTDTGEKPNSARSFLGGLRKDYGEERLAEAIGRCMFERPIEPKAWLAAALRGRKREVVV